MTERQQTDRLIGCAVLGALALVIWLACLFGAFYLVHLTADEPRPWWLWPSKIFLSVVWLLTSYIGMIILKVACRTANEDVK